MGSALPAEKFCWWNSQHCQPRHAHDPGEPTHRVYRRVMPQPSISAPCGDCGKDWSGIRAVGLQSQHCQSTHDKTDSRRVYRLVEGAAGGKPRLATIWSRSSWSRLCWRIEVYKVSISPRIHDHQLTNSPVYKGRARQPSQGCPVAVEPVGEDLRRHLSVHASTTQDQLTSVYRRLRVRTIQSRWCWFRHRPVEKSAESASSTHVPRVYTCIAGCGEVKMDESERQSPRWTRLSDKVHDGRV
jgi:hypothetical protein